MGNWLSDVGNDERVKGEKISDGYIFNTKTNKNEEANANKRASERERDENDGVKQRICFILTEFNV